MNIKIKTTLFLIVGCLAIIIVGHLTGHVEETALFYGTFTGFIALCVLFSPKACSSFVAGILIYGGVVWVTIAGNMLHLTSDSWTWPATACTAFVALMFAFGMLNMIPVHQLSDSGFFACLIPNPPRECNSASSVD